MRVLGSFVMRLRLMSSIKLTATDRRRFARARERGRDDANRTSAVVNARYDQIKDAIILVFRGGTILTIARTRIPALAGLRKSDLRAVVVSPAGDALSWRSADVDIDVGGLIEKVRSVGPTTLVFNRKCL
jgi:hypothetical protein